MYTNACNETDKNVSACSALRDKYCTRLLEGFLIYIYSVAIHYFLISFAGLLFSPTVSGSHTLDGVNLSLSKNDGVCSHSLSSTSSTMALRMKDATELITLIIQIRMYCT